MNDSKSHKPLYRTDLCVINCSVPWHSMKSADRGESKVSLRKLEIPVELPSAKY